MSGLELGWVDVFTDRPLTGNPLAVVLDADRLSDAAMQALAGELGLSETVFVLEHAARLRIFTPARELPLAGHPVVGAAIELARRMFGPRMGVAEDPATGAAAGALGALRVLRGRRRVPSRSARARSWAARAPSASRSAARRALPRRPAWAAEPRSSWRAAWPPACPRSGSRRRAPAV